MFTIYAHPLIYELLIQQLLMDPHQFFFKNFLQSVTFENLSNNITIKLWFTNCSLQFILVIEIEY